MTERRKDILVLCGLLALLIVLFSRILFTEQIIRAPDILNEYYWSVKDIHYQSLVDLMKIHLQPGWSMHINSGYTTEGGDISTQFLKYHNLIYWLFPVPSNVAWFIVLHLFFGGAGTYLFCRAIGCSRVAAFFGGFLFAFATENASLVNAGHVLKIATISYAPLAFFFLERGFQRQRLIWFLACAFTLAFQFFNYHWQIAFYTCLCMAFYGLLRYAFELYDARKRGENKGGLRLLSLIVVLLLFFLTTVSISLLPLANWSKETNRGGESGANQGKGGLERDEAMSWSMPPEELLTFVIPGAFGLSRQESGDVPSVGKAYYWGRMHFTQTNDYLGLLPWLLLPLPLIFRRDRLTLILLSLVAGTLLFSMGKYTPFYNLLYDYFPGINKFRVPKMMLFMTAFAVASLAARGFDLLMEPLVLSSLPFKRYLLALLALPTVLAFFWFIQFFGKEWWFSVLKPMILEPTRYQSGMLLIMDRLRHMSRESVIAFGIASVCVAAIIAHARSIIPKKAIIFLLFLLVALDLFRVNFKFLPLAPVPEKSRNIVTPVMEFLKKAPKEYRMFPLDENPQQYSNFGIPAFYCSMPVQQVRWQNILDTLSFQSTVVDMLNLKYLVLSPEQFAKERLQFGEKFFPVFTSPDGRQVVAENRNVLPKAWLVQSVLAVSDKNQSLGVITNPAFDPRRMAVVESQPELQLLPINMSSIGVAGEVALKRYENSEIELVAKPTANSLLVLGEKYYKGWRAFVDGSEVTIHPVNHVLRGVYLTPGSHKVEFRFDPLPFKIGKYLTLASFALFAAMLVREWMLRRKR